ncbi:pyruvate kinase [Paenibacillus thiaminolyticus]|uniref:pyruvate kinase n=1 Tax=Paenibacillus thiaminolyticus TaxID=49283 RepID=UPI00232F68AC|nr:pyruvate kinase [Paenibacillus thiaminolyticus]WCF06308.1 pyruvate kinase [Paenibacillus thiaminolyticus]
MQLDIKALYEKFLLTNIPNPFTLKDIDNRLKTKYYAEEVDLDKFDGLKKDSHANFDTIVKAYTFKDERGLKELLKLNPDEDLDCYIPNGFHYLLNSNDNEFLSGATEKGMSFVLSLESSIFMGIEESDMVLGNERFEDYLKALYLTEYIQFEDDPWIEKAHKRYKEGFTLRWYGLTDGESIF